MSWRLGIDIGGTFTDFALMKDESLVFDKSSSTPDDPARAVMRGLEELAARESLSMRDFLRRLDRVVHGTTVADNTLIEQTGARTGLLTTEGFRDELELRRGYKEDIWDVRLPPPPTIVPRRRRLGVPERILHDGSVDTALDEAAARRAIECLLRQGIESLAICTLFSFVNPSHEQRLAELARELAPELPISLSHRVLPKAPEFERTSTTVLNAYLGPRVSGYLDRLADGLREAGYEHDLLVMQSSGGAMTRDYLRESPVRVLASGPAGGVIGAAGFARAKDAPDLLCVDMGGTSYDVSLVRGGTAPAEPGWNWHHRYVLGLPMVSVETLGAGGGSICRLEEGRLCVGPESAGADPGPVCYGQGGSLPTLTDVNLVLGLLTEDAPFAGGRLRLQLAGVEAAFERELAGPLGCSVEDAAFDCWRVVNANLTQAVRRWTAERGTDPRTLSLLAYGGNGPVFAGVQARELGIERVFAPRASPAFSALGALAADPSIDEERSCLCSAAEADPARLAALWEELDTRAEHHFAGAGFVRARLHSRYQLNLRYPGQNWSLPVDVADLRGAHTRDFVDEGVGERAASDFHARHRAEYGHERLDEAPEITGVRLITHVALPLPRFGAGLQAPAREAEPSGQRRANLGDGFKPTPIYAGPELAPGALVHGPAVIEERFTTIVVYPGWQARVDDGGDYLLIDS